MFWTSCSSLIPMLPTATLKHKTCQFYIRLAIYWWLIRYPLMAIAFNTFVRVLEDGISHWNCADTEGIDSQNFFSLCLRNNKLLNCVLLFPRLEGTTSKQNLQTCTLQQTNENFVFNYLLHLELDGGLQVVNFLLHVVAMGKESRELAGLVETRSQQTGNLLDQGL